jgi:hypothetical protein
MLKNEIISFLRTEGGACRGANSPQQEGKKSRGQEGTPVTSPACDALTLQQNGRTAPSFGQTLKKA